MLVESEKTALVCTIEFPGYVWLAYGRINGLTNDKIQVLKGESVTIIPDISENAVSIAYKKVKEMKGIGVHVEVFDMADGRCDEELKKDGIYNDDLEDIIKNLVTS